MAGASKPITVYMKHQRSRRRVRDGARFTQGAVPYRVHDMKSRMPERARTDPREPQGSNPLGPPGPELVRGHQELGRHLAHSKAWNRACKISQS